MDNEYSSGWHNGKEAGLDVALDILREMIECSFEDYAMSEITHKVVINYLNAALGEIKRIKEEVQ